MKGYYEITDVYAREILDSRGNPTVEVEVIGTDNKFYTIHLDASNPTTDINNIGVTNLTKKTIINGSLVIIKNGVKYNALGQIID